jgi:hypothetical protein
MENDVSKVFYRLYGDVTGYASSYARVNNTDSVQFNNAYLSDYDDSNYRPDFDFNFDGHINNSDDLQFNNRYVTAWTNFTPTM